MLDGYALVGDLAGLAAADAVAQMRAGTLPPHLGAIEDYIQRAIENFLVRYGPTLGEKLAAYAAPAAQKAVEVIKPSVEQALKDYTPTFAAIAGGMIGLAVLLGVYVARRTYRQRRGRRWAA